MKLVDSWFRNLARAFGRVAVHGGMIDARSPRHADPPNGLRKSK
jgi:hypothetical protein